MRKFAIIWAALVLGLVGCAGPNTPVLTPADDSARVDTTPSTLEYLQRQNPPALKAVQTWQSDYGPGLKLTTEHYEVYTTLLDPLMLSQVPGFVESAYRGYNSQLPEPIETQTRFTVYLFADRKQWEEFTDKFAGWLAPTYRRIKKGAYCLNAVCVAYNIGRERTFSVLGHEGWHQFNSRHFRFRLPSWLDEGIAMLFEANRYDRGMFYFEPGRNLYRLGDLKMTLTKKKIIPLRELIAVNPGEVLSTEGTDAITAFYCQSYALVRFLREDDYGRRLGQYHTMLLDGLMGKWPLDEVNGKIAADRNIPLTVRWNRTVGPELFAHYISDDIEQIEKEYLAFCRKLVYHVRFK
ncbi:MAG TPA: hypothetical protein VMX13_02125 [Sedimentisphaerales bacterium]|nr:hypothetical protein [Sedimentisphaerales bacterium]